MTGRSATRRCVHRAVSSFASGTADLTVYGFDVTLIESGFRQGCRLTVYPVDRSYEYRDITFSGTDRTRSR